MSATETPDRLTFPPGSSVSLRSDLPDAPLLGVGRVLDVRGYTRAVRWGDAWGTLQDVHEGFLRPAPDTP